jgi:hypothetical protein
MLFDAIQSGGGSLTIQNKMFTSIFRVEDEIGATLSSHLLLKFYQTTRHHILQDSVLNSVEI